MQMNGNQSAVIAFKEFMFAVRACQNRMPGIKAYSHVFGRIAVKQSVELFKLIFFRSTHNVFNRNPYSFCPAIGFHFIKGFKSLLPIQFLKGAVRFKIFIGKHHV